MKINKTLFFTTLILSLNLLNSNEITEFNFDGDDSDILELDNLYTSDLSYNYIIEQFTIAENLLKESSYKDTILIEDGVFYDFYFQDFFIDNHYINNKLIDDEYSDFGFSRIEMIPINYLTLSNVSPDVCDNMTIKTNEELFDYDEDFIKNLINSEKYICVEDKLTDSFSLFEVLYFVE